MSWDQAWGEMNECNINNAIIKFDTHLHDARRAVKKKKKHEVNNAPKIAMEKANAEGRRSEVDLCAIGH